MAFPMEFTIYCLECYKSDSFSLHNSISHAFILISVSGYILILVLITHYEHIRIKTTQYLSHKHRLVRILIHSLWPKIYLKRMGFIWFCVSLFWYLLLSNLRHWIFKYLWGHFCQINCWIRYNCHQMKVSLILNMALCIWKIKKILI